MCTVPHGFWLPQEIEISPEIIDFLASPRCSVANKFSLVGDIPAKVVDILKWFETAAIDPWVPTGFVLVVLDNIAEGESPFYLSRLCSTLIFVENASGKRKSLKCSWRENTNPECVVAELGDDDLFWGDILILQKLS
ncbi:MAG: hypothetical protein KBC26_01850 [Candidatus Pacebacteria bacterium]|nr:hypothetical protein [Candidatus Paceibacterota bacterium]